MRRVRRAPVASPRRSGTTSSKQCNTVFLLFLASLSLAMMLIATSMQEHITPDAIATGLPTIESFVGDSQAYIVETASGLVRDRNIPNMGGDFADSKNSTTATIGNIDKGAAIASTTPTTRNATTIAYAISLIKCDSVNSHSAGLVDAALVLRHSIHKISVRNPHSGSKYDYKMYAIIHKQAEVCSETLKHAGFETLVVDPPIQQTDIQEGTLVRKHVHKAFCCGHHEFVKLYAYKLLPEEIVVHTDIDFAFFKPMDHLFDAMLYDKDSPEGKLARSKIERERNSDPWPDRIEAFITRDWHQVAPHKFPPAYQAGFLVARRNPQVLEQAVQIVLEGNYTDGWGYASGWGGKGYGGFVGAMAMQGLMAYVYDHIRPNTAVELNQCRYNHMGLDVRYNGPPNFNPKWGRRGMCRNAHPQDLCEDCLVTNSSKIYNIHYTQCRKPWACIGVGYRGGKKPNSHRYDFAIDTNAGTVDHCMMLLEKWHSVRKDLEDQLYQLTGDETILAGRNGTYKSEVFWGHCTEDGQDGYLRLAGQEASYQRFHELYGS